MSDDCDYQFENEYFIDPQEYCEIVLGAPKERISGIICREIARLGGMDLAGFQSFVHHEHPGSVEEDLACLESWRTILKNRFPEFRFVIEIEPCFKSTWYQATQTAPTDDDEDWATFHNYLSYTAAEWVTMDNEARRAKEAACHKCGATEFTEPVIHPDHRGVMMCKCPECGHSRIHSTRIIRERVNW